MSGSLGRPVFTVILTVGFSHFLNDMMQSLLAAIYPSLKTAFTLSFTQLGWITIAYQLTASVLQPVVGWYADRRSMPYSVLLGTLFTCGGLVVLALAATYPLLLTGACLLGVGSSIFHPESSRVVRIASGGHVGLAQSLFQVGGNVGTALGPLCAAFVVMRWGKPSLLLFAALTIVSTALSWKVANWYRRFELTRRNRTVGRTEAALSKATVIRGLMVLLILIFSKYVYVASLTNYYTFYLIERFHISVLGAQIYLFVFLAAMAAGTLLGGPIADRIGRKTAIWISVLAVLPFTLLLPYANAFWAIPLTVIIGVLMASSFPVIVVFGQELIPHRLGLVSGLLFGFSFGAASLGAASLGHLADLRGIEFVYALSAYLPAIGLVVIALPDRVRITLSRFKHE